MKGRKSLLTFSPMKTLMKDDKVVDEGSYEELTRSKDSHLCQLMPDLQ